MIAEPLYLLADTAVVGRLGTPELGGLAIAATILVTAYTIFIFLAYGTTGRVARLLGAGDVRAAARYGVQGMWLGLGIGVAIATLGAVFAEPLVNILGGRGEVRLHALTYLRISVVGLPALLVSLSGIGYLRGLQDTRTPLIVTVVTNVVNLALEIVLIFGLGFGIGASALSTVVAQTLGAGVFVTIVARDVRRAGVPVAPDTAVLRSLMGFGFELFLRTVSLRAVLVIAIAVSARIGTVELAANQITLELWNTLAFILDAVAIAGQTMIPNLLGAGRADEARAAARRMIQWGIVVGFVLAVIVGSLRWQIASVFTNDPAVIEVAAFLLLFGAAFQPIAAIAFVLDGVLIGAGDQRYLAIAMLVAALTFVPVAVSVLVFDLGMGFLWGGIGLFMATRAATLLHRFRTPRWQVVGSLTPTGGL